MNVLVTGGLGYIGSHTVVELLLLGHEVLIIDNLSNSKESVLQGIEAISNQKPNWLNMDIRDPKLAEVLDEHKVEAVIHFAAYKAVGESVEKPLKYFDNNIGGLLNLSQAMAKAEVKPMVFSSSCTVYGDTKNSPITEEHPRVKAISPYGTTKIISEEILEDLSEHGPLKTISLRYFNPVGAHPSGLIGELPLGIPSNLVPFITQTAAGIRDRLTVFGNDYNTPDGSNVRDFIHVVDLAKAHVKALDRLQNMPDSYQTYNLGTGKGHSVLEVIASFERISGIELHQQIGKRRPGDVEQIWADASKAERELGWTCEYDLDEMMQTAWNWQQKLGRS